MDYQLKNTYRKYLEDATWASYLRYYAEAERANIEPVCWAGAGECPHCVLGQIDRLYGEMPDDHELIYRHIREMFLNYQLTPNGTYLLERAPLQPENSAPWLPALYYALVPRREPYTKKMEHRPGIPQLPTYVHYTPRVPRLVEIRGHGELCWGSDPFRQKSKEECIYGGVYGFTEWPEHVVDERPLHERLQEAFQQSLDVELGNADFPEEAETEEDFHPDFDRWMEEISRIGNNCGAVYADIEAKIEGNEFIYPELGPINMHSDRWHMFRITFLDEAGHAMPQHETLFIGQCMENEEGCYGRDLVDFSQDPSV